LYKHIPVLNAENHRCSAYGKVYVDIINKLSTISVHLPSTFFHLTSYFNIFLVKGSVKVNVRISVIPLFRKFVNPFFARKIPVFFVRIGKITIFAT